LAVTKKTASKKEKTEQFSSKTIWTIGHSTRSISEFITLLSETGIELLADIRRFPSSARYPHFNKDALAHTLRTCGIGYLHIEELGGRRKPLPDSKNSGWKNTAFRGYADYMETDEFLSAAEKLENESLQRAAHYGHNVL
jgi:uncharacterized protein (DUF488 family)